MKHRKIVRVMLIVGMVLACLAGAARTAQDKYTLKVPNGLAFSEFRGYESWQVISISQDGDLVAAILGNPVMIKAYQAGIPGNGKPFPDGAKDGEGPLEPDENANVPPSNRARHPA